MSSREGMNARGREDSGGEGGRKKSGWRRNEGRRRLLEEGRGRGGDPGGRLDASSRVTPRPPGDSAAEKPPIGTRDESLGERDD